MTDDQSRLPFDAPAQAASEPFAYRGVAITRRDEMLSLTDMWKAAGTDPARAPAEWMRSADAQRFIGFAIETLNVGNSHDEIVRTVRGGRQPGTWAHWQIAFAYAKYLSPEFHMWCNTIVRQKMESLRSTIIQPDQVETIGKNARKGAAGASAGMIKNQIKPLFEELMREQARIHDRFYNLGGFLKEFRGEMLDFKAEIRDALRSAVAAETGTGAPQLEHYVEMGGVYTILFNYAGRIDQRGALTPKLSRHLDMFCKRNRILMASWPICGRDMTFWPRSAVMKWLEVEGSAITAMIDNHRVKVRNKKRGSDVVAFRRPE